MARYINADAIKKEGWHMQRIRQKDNHTMVLETKKPSEFQIAEVVERNKGEWVSLNGLITCSKCGCEPPNETNIESDFCPNCGADMRGENLK